MYPKGRILRAPLIPIQPMDEPFKRIAMGIVGPLNRSARGHKLFSYSVTMVQNTLKMSLLNQLTVKQLPVL